MTCRSLIECRVQWARPAHEPGLPAVQPSGFILARKSSPTAPIVAQPTLQAPAPFHGAASCPGNRRRAVPLSAQSTRQGVGAVRVGDTCPQMVLTPNCHPTSPAGNSCCRRPSAAPRQPWELTPYAIALSMKGRRHPPRRRGSRGSRPPSRSSGRWSPAAPAPSFREQALGQSAAIVRPGHERSCAALSRWLRRTFWCRPNTQGSSHSAIQSNSGLVNRRLRAVRGSRRLSASFQTQRSTYFFVVRQAAHRGRRSALGRAHQLLPLLVVEHAEPGPAGRCREALDCEGVGVYSRLQQSTVVRRAVGGATEWAPTSAG